MKTFRTFCDMCGAEFKSEYWDCQPVHMIMTMTAPAQKYDSRDYEEICYDCRAAIRKVFEDREMLKQSKEVKFKK